jgi:hypothetical protein
MRVFQVGVDGGGHEYFQEHASTQIRAELNSPDKHRTIEPRPIVAPIVGEPAAGDARLSGWG